MGSIKRFLNLATLLCTLFLLLMILLMLTGQISDWTVFLSYNFGSLMIAYAVIAAVNYVAFGTVTLWHRNTTSTIGK